MNCEKNISIVDFLFLFLTGLNFQGGQCLSEVARVELRRGGRVHERAQRRGQPQLQPTLDGRTRIDPYHANSEAAHHSECEHAGEKSVKE